MPAIEYNLDLVQTETFQPGWKLRTRGAPVHLTGYGARSQWRSKINSPQVLAELTTENGGIVIDSEAATLHMFLPDATRDALLATSYLRLAYDLFLTSPTSRDYLLLRGQILLNRSVTRNG